MDFQKLMQKASANQVLAEKKHVLQRKQKEVEKKREIQIQHSQQKKAAEQLRVMKETALKKHLEYKGLASQASRPLVTSSSSSQEQIVKSSTLSSIAKGTITEKKSSPPSKHKKLNNTKHKGKSESSPTQKSKLQQKSPSSQSKTAVKPSPVSNFQDLMKIAQSNSKSCTKDTSLKNKGTGDEPKMKGSSSPVGKLLLERSQRPKLKAKAEVNPNSEEKRKSDSSCALSSKSKVLLSPSRADDLVRRPLRDPISTNATKMPKHHSKLNTSRAPITNGGNTPTSSVGTKLPHSISTSGSQTSVRGFKTPSVPLKLSQKQQQEKERLKTPASAKAHIRQVPHSKPLNATAFYGAAAARILGKDGSFTGSRYTPAKYTSSWVDEMSDYLRSEDIDDSEDDEDLDDFLDDDFIDDDGTGEDYSSAIREIFGYDRRRFNEERFDDAAMESSYTQQEFEEKRSARLGQLEDEEELRREQGRLLKKRKRTSGTEKASKYGKF